MNAAVTPIVSAPPISEVLRERVACLQPELRDRLMRLLVGAGAGVMALLIRAALAETPAAGLITTFIVEPLLLEIVHTVLF